MESCYYYTISLGFEQGRFELVADGARDRPKLLSMYTIYNLLTAAGMLLLLPYFFVRGLLRGESFGHARERLGWSFPPELQNGQRTIPRDGAIWLHAVSVGEVQAALPLASRLQERFPQRPLVISTTTTTGQKLAHERLPSADAFLYFPLDWKGPVTRALKAVHPAAVVIMETEIWPNFLRQSRRAGVPVIFVNGRLSEKSFRGFRRGVSLSGGVLQGFLTRILKDATLFLMQSEKDAERLLQLGAEPKRVIVTGNLKYDLGASAPTPLSDWLGRALARYERAPVVVAGSVLLGEVEAVLRAFASVECSFPRALLVLAPRKPDHFDAVARIVAASRRTSIRRSAITLCEDCQATLSEPGSVFLLDSVGELAGLYRLADTVFVGGSLVPGGGHNLLEPAAYRKPPVYGPFMENFQEISAIFLEAGAAIQVTNAEELSAVWLQLLSDRERSAQKGAAAYALVEQNRGATARVLVHIEQIVTQARSVV
jgi:3-deoxy-D-manno-octulosonic-acid transferase